MTRKVHVVNGDFPVFFSLHELVQDIKAGIHATSSPSSTRCEKLNLRDFLSDRNAKAWCTTRGDGGSHRVISDTERLKCRDGSYDRTRDFIVTRVERAIKLTQLRPGLILGN